MKLKVITLSAALMLAPHMVRASATATSNEYSEEIYEKLRATEPLYEARMTKSQRGRAAGLLPHCPPVGHPHPSFLTTPEGVSAQSFVGVASPWTDGNGRAWYVIDRNNGPGLFKVASDLYHKDPSRPDYAIEGPLMVKSGSFQNPSYFGCQYKVINNKDLGKRSYLLFTLYPVQQIGPW